MSGVLGRAVFNLDVDDSGFTRGLDKAEAQSRSWTDRVSANFQNVGKGLATSGGAITAGLTIPLARLAVTAIGSAADYQQAMNVFAVTTSASADQMQRADDLAKQLGADLALPSTSALDASAAMLELGKAGLSINDVFGATRGVLELSAAGQLSNADAASIAANALNAFNLAGTETTRVADLLAAAANASSADVRGVALSLQQVAAIAAAAGVPIEDTVAAIAELANAGIQGSDAGTSLKAMFLSLQGPSDKAAKLMRELGLNVYDSAGAMLPFRDIIEVTQGALGGLTEEQRNTALATIFGSDAVRAANIVLLGGVGAYDQMKGAVTEAGAAAELAAARSEGLAGAWDGLQSTIETALLNAAEPALDFLERLVEGLSGAITWVSQLDSDILIAAGSFAGFLAVLGPLAAGLGLLLLFANPVTLAIAAIAIALAALGAGAVLAARNWDAIIEKFPEVGQAATLLKESFEILFETGKNVFPPLADIIVGWATAVIGAWKSAASVVGGLGKIIFAILTGNFDEIDDIFRDTLQSITDGLALSGEGFLQMAGGIGGAIDGAIDGLSRTTDATDAQRKATEQARDKLKGYLELLRSGAPNALGTQAAIALMAQAQDESAAASNRAASALSNLMQVQSGFDANTSKAAENISTWETNLGEAERALGILNDQVAAGTPLSEEQAKQYDILTEGVGRYQGGIEDMEGAFVSAAVAEATFTFEQDKLNAALANKDITPEQYAAGVQDLKDAYVESTGPAGALTVAQNDLAEAVGGVIDKLRELLVDLGIIPDTADAVNDSIFDVQSNLDILDGATATPSVGLDTSEFHDAAAGVAGAMGGGAGGVPGGAGGVGVTASGGGGLNALTAQPTVTLNTLLFDQGHSQVMAALARVPESFTIAAYVDIGGALSAIQVLRDSMPSSPAKTGPFRTLPEWDAIFEGLPLAAIARGAEAIDGLSHVLLDGIAATRPGVTDALDRLDLGGLILRGVRDQFTATVLPGMEISGEELAEALAEGISSGTVAIDDVMQFVTDDAIVSLLELQAQLRADLQLGQISGADVSALDEQLAAISALIDQWAADTGGVIDDLFIADNSEAIEEGWLDLLSNLDGIISGEFQTGIQEQLDDVLRQMATALATGAPEGVIEALQAKIDELTLLLEEAGRLAGEAWVLGFTEVATSGTGPWTEEGRIGGLIDNLLMGEGTTIPDAVDEITSILDGSLAESLQETLANQHAAINFAVANNWPRAIIDAMTAEAAATEAQLGDVLSQIIAAAAEGMVAPEVLEELGLALAPIVALPLEQIGLLLPQMSDGGASLIDELVSGVASGEADYAAVLALLVSQTDVAMDDLDETTGIAVEDMIANLEDLQDALLVDLAEALIAGADPSGIEANIDIITQLLADLQEQAEETADRIIQIGNLSPSEGFRPGATGTMGPKPPKPPPPPELVDLLGGLDPGLLLDAITDAVADVTIAVDGEEVKGLETTFADEQLALLQEVFASPDSFVAGSQEHVLAALNETLAGLNLDALSQLDLSNIAFEGAGISPLAAAVAPVTTAIQSLPDQLASTLSQSLRDMPVRIQLTNNTYLDGRLLTSAVDEAQDRDYRATLG